MGIRKKKIRRKSQTEDLIIQMELKTQMEGTVCIPSPFPNPYYLTSLIIENFIQHVHLNETPCKANVSVALLKVKVIAGGQSSHVEDSSSSTPHLHNLERIAHIFYTGHRERSKAICSEFISSPELALSENIPFTCSHVQINPLYTYGFFLLV